MSRISSLWRRTFGIIKEHVGTDHFGNKYFSIPEQKTWSGRTVRARRMVEPANPTESEYEEGNIPSEWDAWMRGRRKLPPTPEELQQNTRYREQIKLQALQVEQRDQALQAQEYEEGLVARPTQTLIKGHASSTHYAPAQTGRSQSAPPTPSIQGHGPHLGATPPKMTLSHLFHPEYFSSRGTTYFMKESAVCEG